MILLCFLVLETCYGLKLSNSCVLPWLFFFFQASPTTIGARQVVVEMKRTTTRGKLKDCIIFKGCGC